MAALRTGGLPPNARLLLNGRSPLSGKCPWNDQHPLNGPRPPAARRLPNGWRPPAARHLPNGLRPLKGRRLPNGWHPRNDQRLWAEPRRLSGWGRRRRPGAALRPWFTSQCLKRCCPAGSRVASGSRGTRRGPQTGAAPSPRPHTARPPNAPRQTGPRCRTPRLALGSRLADRRRTSAGPLRSGGRMFPRGSAGRRIAPRRRTGGGGRRLARGGPGFSVESRTSAQRNAGASHWGSGKEHSRPRSLIHRCSAAAT